MSSHVHHEGCCTGPASSVTQTVDELEFERGLWTAALEGDIQRVEALLRSGRDPNAKDNSGYTALHYAARSGCPQVCRTLLRASANANAATPGGTTPLHRAAYMGRTECVKVLLKGAIFCYLSRNMIITVFLLQMAMRILLFKILME